MSSSEEVQISKLVCKWKDLEELELESKPSNFLELAENISMHCKNFCRLMVSSSIREEDAIAVARYLPKLKILELRRSYLRKEELLIILNGCRELERLSLKDCIGFDGNEREILAKVSQIKEFKSEGCKLYYEHSYEFDDDFSSGCTLYGFVH
ncbi:hypothetical protein HPP92_018945 [Vanilla planifolia]|uniref:F-box/LRR-repeat protein 15/At3g58940/PEG3-like LRR domain-containing protein n=1 Tax=Vanilla planifolia TaxID=51239 RepID=A0A835Q215_VANPL|nr:hypothetical protein HPP92_018945 [Vanilla planifolia]